MDSNSILIKAVSVMFMEPKSAVLKGTGCTLQISDEELEDASIIEEDASFTKRGMGIYLQAVAAGLAVALSMSKEKKYFTEEEFFEFFNERLGKLIKSSTGSNFVFNAGPGLFEHGKIEEDLS